MKKRLLEQINTPSDLRALNVNDLPQLAYEIRQFIIEIVSVKQGHLGASLGVVELTIALHYLFDTPNDLLIWDVGHQAYGHKILTERKHLFNTNRQLGGLSGFPKRKESKYDPFGTGHSSTSISAALGMAVASKLKGEDSRHHIAVIGDASLASGMAFEALNHGGATDANLWVILNDNAMSIDPSVGALKEYFIKQDNSSKNELLNAFNFVCEGPLDGHDIPILLKGIKKLKSIKGPKFLHIRTTKGKGLQKAEENQVIYHAPGPFDIKTGILTSPDSTLKPPKYQDVFGKTLVELAEKNSKIVGITPAMPTGTSLKYMMEAFPDRFFDVGIAEQHAITFCAGLATQGYKPYCAIYSTFLQRAYDQLIHDVVLQKLPVVFCVDRAGLVGEDGATHHGVYDVAFLRSIPDIYIYAPKNEIDLRNILYTSQLDIERPLIIRYPRGRGVTLNWKQEFSKIQIGKSSLLRKGEGSRLAIISLGNMAYHVEKAINHFNRAITHIDIGFIKPLDEKMLHKVFKSHSTIITVEDGVLKGGLSSAVSEFSCQNQYNNKVISLGIPDQIIPHGSIEELQEICGISPNKILQTIKKFY